MAPPCDVLVLGAGPGGCAAAVEAARAGARVVLAEASAGIGGNAARSTGYLAFLDFPMQHEAGIADSEERFVADILREVASQQERYGVIFDVAQAQQFVREVRDLWGFLADLGFAFTRFIRRPAQHTADRMVDVADTAMFTRCFARALEGLGVEVRTGVRGVALLRDDERVAGAVLRNEVDGTEEEMPAARGVVLATGGYQANPALRQRYQPAHLAGTPYLGLATCRGDGHVLGQAVGGDLVNMTMIPPLIMVASAFVEESVAVNAHGERFHDEAGPYDRRVDALGLQPGRRAWYVCDDDVGRRKAGLIAQMPEPPVTAGSLAELAAAIGCPATTLEATMARWNACLDSEAPVDADHGRVIFPADRRGIRAAPFSAVPMVVGVNFPAGGFRVTDRMAVVDAAGVPIAGLYAVGDCVGGVSAAIGLGGLKITPALALGRVAGRAAAAGERGGPIGGDLLAAEPVPALPEARIAIVHVEGTS